MITRHLYNKFAYKLLTGDAIDFSGDTIKVALFEDDYDEDLAAEFFDEIVGTEIVGVGYDAGGQELANPSVSEELPILFSADNSEWTGATITGVRFAILRKDTGDPATSPVVGYIDFGENKSVLNGTFMIQWNETDKVLKLTSEE